MRVPLTESKDLVFSCAGDLPDNERDLASGRKQVPRLPLGMTEWRGADAELCSAGQPRAAVPTWSVITLLGVSNRELHEVVGADYPEDQAHGNRELFSGGIVDDCGSGQAIMAAAGLQFASAGG